MNYPIKNVVLPFICLFLLHHFAAAQCPPGGNLVFWTQTDIDSFPIKYPNCKKLEGAVEINKPSTPPGLPVSDLTPLLGMDTIMSYLRIYVQELSDLRGLDSLKFVGSDLEIWSGFGGDNFESLAGLDNLKTVGGNLSIGVDLPKLKNLRGLEQLRRVAKDFIINNAAIETLDGLENLQKVGAIFDIRAESLHALSGLDQLDTVVGVLQISNPVHLKNLEGLLNFKHGGVYIFSADSLVNVAGLENWRSGSLLWITECPLLTSLTGIENLETLLLDAVLPGLNLPALWLADNSSLQDVSALDHPVALATGVRLKNNPQLSACSVQAICDYLSTPLGPMDTVDIGQNMVNCNSESEVLSFCASATEGWTVKNGIEVSPNPLAAGAPLRIFMDNNFTGIVNIEIIGWDGRILYRSEKEKTEPQQLFELRDLPPSGHFLVRVIENDRVMTQLVLRY